MCQHILLRGDNEKNRVSGDNFFSHHKTTNTKNIGNFSDFKAVSNKSLIKNDSKTANCDEKAQAVLKWQVREVPHTPKMTTKGQNCAMLWVKN